MDNLDYRGRPIQHNKEGKRILHQPTKQLDQCFDITNISWSTIIPIFHAKAVPGRGIVKEWVNTEMIFTSGHVESATRKKHKNYDD